MGFRHIEPKLYPFRSAQVVGIAALAVVLVPRPIGGQSVSGQSDADARLRTQVLQVLIKDPVLGEYALTASIADHHTVVLQGRLPRAQDKQLATARAKAVSGVKKVKNEIQVDPAVMPLTVPVAAATPASTAGARATPADVQATIQNALATYPELGQVTVKVSESEVDLGGSVTTAADRDRAISIARQNAAALPVVDHIRIGRS